MIGGGYNRSTITTGGNYDLVYTSNAYPANATSKGHRFLCGSDGGGGPTEKLRITSDGDVGIGHEKPSAGLHIKRPGRNFSLNQFYDGYNSDSGLGGDAGSIAGSQVGERTHSLILESTTTAAADRGSSIGFRAKSGTTLIDVTYAAIVGAKENSVTNSDPDTTYDDQAKGYLAFYTSNQYAYSPHYGTHNIERLRITSAGDIHSKNSVQSGGNATGGFKFAGVDTACVLGIQQPSSGADTNAAFQIWDGASNNLRINYDGTIKLASGAGIDFSAAESSNTTDSSVLADYEKGRWNSTVSWSNSLATTGGGTLSTSTVQGHFIKIDKLVWVNLELTPHTYNGGDTCIIIKCTLPFTPDVASHIGLYAYSGTVCYGAEMNGPFHLQGYATTGALMYAYGSTIKGGSGFYGHKTGTTNASCTFTGCYRTAS